jgi:lipopolysaccharide heptosyltransferase I
MTTDYKNVLIIKPSALGDIVHALPVLPALRAALPDARITWLVRKEFAPLLECVDGLDKILLFDRQLLAHWYRRPAAFRALRDFRRTLKNSRYDLVLDLQGLLRTALFGWMTDCPRRIGMADSREFAGLFYTRKVPPPESSVHVLDYYHALLKDAGIDAAPAAETLFKVPAEAAAAVRQKLAQAGAGQGYFVLIPGSAHTSKCWPAERFAKMAEDLHHRFRAAVVMVGTQQDKPQARAIGAQCRTPLIDLTAKTPLVELVALLQQAAGVVSNDTGPGYIAAAAGAPTVIIYGQVNPQRLAPYGRPEYVAAIEPDRRGIGIRTANPAYDIKQVTFELVWEKLNALLVDNPMKERQTP